ncbi:Asp-tRNA(Asn)/Glu-tRNA(Gln) amidotransferase subunit GatB [Spiroplasma endosymbiont of Aspidapion aeneum]|uniref:Asp-tRNA(Asn)/Glu-tRNA(Gln) amidotransferase subunit GatB n=1 Tax=Spiroplasma endosymbiont of Aspidapion aeneum TaxID=3066276 RepID=UPI00313B9C3A
MSNFEVIIGIENHIELKSKTKAFSPAVVSFGEQPNTCVNERDLGLPGILPSPNKECVAFSILACNALNMKIDPLLRFDRKNYYYSDLPKGYQITQQFFPLGSEGYLEININDQNKKIEIERLHMEEDTAKQIHDQITKIDYNRSGIALIEVVSKPQIRSANEAVAYVSRLREILLFLDISDLKMNEGSLRCDINISLRPIGFKGFGTKVEIKNLNSLSNIKKAIEFEINRQKKLLLMNKKILQETKRFNETTQETQTIRVKADADDYKYFPEPNIVPIKLDKKWIDKIVNNSPETYDKKKEIYSKNYKLGNDDINYILHDISLVKFYEKCIMLGADPLRSANLIINDIKDLLNKATIDIDKSNLNPEDIVYVQKLLISGKISSKHLKLILQNKFETNKNIDEIINENNYVIISSKFEIESLLKPILSEQKDFIKKEYVSRPQRVEKQIMGMLMKVSGGNVNPEVAMVIITKKIQQIM